MFGKKRNKNGTSDILEERRLLLTSNSDFFAQEAYKTLRTNVTFSLADEESCKAIVVTSALQGEGKSLTALNLAISYAQAEKKVLLIDSDLRRPKIARLLDIKGSAGLSNLLMNPGLLDEAVHATETPGLDVILAGSIPPNPSELLGSERMSALLERLRERYDIIVLDCPPVNMVTDAMVLAPKCDGVLFVVRANQSDRVAVNYAVEQMEYAKVKLLGFVFNGASSEGSGYGYRKYGRGRYGYRKYGRGRYGYRKYYAYDTYENTPQEESE